MVFVKKWQFIQLFFLGNLGRGNFFCGIVDRKSAILAYKNKNFKISKNFNFSKGITHGFGPKMVIFLSFFFQGIQAMKMSFTIFQNEKTPFQAINKRSSKDRKKDIFPKGLTHGFGPQWPFFQLFFFRKYRPRKCLLRYFRTKKLHSRL